MGYTLFILNENPYSSERAFNAFRLAGTLAGKEDMQVRLFLMAEAVTFAKAGQDVPSGYDNLQPMLGKILRHSDVALCAACLDKRGISEPDLLPGTRRSNLAELAEWTVGADKVLVF